MGKLELMEVRSEDKVQVGVMVLQLDSKEQAVMVHLLAVKEEPMVDRSVVKVAAMVHQLEELANKDKVEAGEQVLELEVQELQLSVQVVKEVMEAAVANKVAAGALQLEDQARADKVDHGMDHKVSKEHKVMEAHQVSKAVHGVPQAKEALVDSKEAHGVHQDKVDSEDKVDLGLKVDSESMSVVKVHHTAQVVNLTVDYTAQAHTEHHQEDHPVKADLVWV